MIKPSDAPYFINSSVVRPAPMIKSGKSPSANVSAKNSLAFSFVKAVSSTSMFIAFSMNWKNQVSSGSAAPASLR